MHINKPLRAFILPTPDICIFIFLSKEELNKKTTNFLHGMDDQVGRFLGKKLVEVTLRVNSDPMIVYFAICFIFF